MSSCDPTLTSPSLWAIIATPVAPPPMPHLSPDPPVSPGSSTSTGASSGSSGSGVPSPNSELPTVRSCREGGPSSGQSSATVPPSVMCRHSRAYATCGLRRNLAAKMVSTAQRVWAAGRSGQGRSGRGGDRRAGHEPRALKQSRAPRQPLGRSAWHPPRLGHGRAPPPRARHSAPRAGD
jgi:hypothetical protein